jgi:hypothetical protein
MILAAFVLSLPAQLPDVKLNYTTVAVPLSRICEDLSKQTGVRLRVTDDLASEPVVIRFVDVPAKEALDKLASTIRAEWVTNKEGMLLTRTQRLQQKLEEQEFRSKVEFIRRNQRQAMESMGGDFTPAEARRLVTELAALAKLDPERRGTSHWLAQRNLYARTPMSRLAARLLNSFEPEYLASLPTFERVIFSSNPTAMQRPLPKSRDFLRLFQEEQALFHEAAGEDMKAIGHFFSGEFPSGQEQDLALFVDSQEGGLNIYLLNSEFKAVGAQSITFGWDSGWDTRALEQERAKEIAADQPISIDPLIRELANRVQMTMGDMEQRPPLSSEAVKALLNPETQDPLSFGFSQLFLKTAERKNKSVVAYGSDAAEQIAIGQLMRDARPKRVMLWLDRDRTLQLEESDKWLTCGAKMPLQILQDRMPRGPFGQFLREFNREGFVSISNTAALAQAANEFQIRMLGWYYVTLLKGNQNTTPLEYIPLVRFYASLSPEQLNAVRGGSKLSLASLSPDQYAQVQRLVYATRLNSSAPMVGDAWEKWAEDLRYEPTIALPDGLPEGTQVELGILDESRYLLTMVRDEGQPAFEQALTLGGIATQYAQHKRTDLFPFAGAWDFRFLIPARVVRLDLKIHPTDTLYARTSFEEKRPVGDRIEFQQFLESMSEEEQLQWDQWLAKANERFNRIPAEARQPQAVPPPPPPSR